MVGRRLDVRATGPRRGPSRKRTAARVAYQGEPGAFSEKAARQVFGSTVKTLPRPSFRDVFEAVASGKARHGILPVENTLGGSIVQNYDLLAEYDVRIVGEMKLRVVHSLIANRGTGLGDVRRVYAHPQAAAQCERLLRRHPEWQVYQVYDTAGSVRMIKEEGLADGAAIAGAAAAEKFDMEVLKEGIESDPQNYTRFVVIARKARVPKGARLKTSLAYGTKNRPGALLRTLEVFNRHGINLTKLESRPIPGRPWEYLFYVDLDGTPDRKVLREVRRHTTRLKMLGVYPSE
ncbi:MAG: prephenate dehydratase [Planctomycetota bacterium]